MFNETTPEAYDGVVGAKIRIIGETLTIIQALLASTTSKEGDIPTQNLRLSMFSCQIDRVNGSHLPRPHSDSDETLKRSHHF